MPDIREVDLAKHQRIYHRCSACGFESSDDSFFGKIQIPTPEDEWSEGMFDAFMMFCAKCFEEVSREGVARQMRIIKAPTRKIPEKIKIPEIHKPKIKPVPRKGGLFG